MRRTIVEVDLKGYSDIARDLEQHFSADIVMRFNDQIQGFVDAALSAVAGGREQSVMATTGDGAILMFDDPAVAHHFAEAVHETCKSHNDTRTVGAAKRWFRIGIATGDIALREDGGHRYMAGSVIARAVRLEAASRIGEILADADTYASLPRPCQAHYGDEEEVPGKRDEKFLARRYVVVPNLDGAVSSATAVQSKPLSTPAQQIWKKKLEYLQEQHAVTASPALKFELKCQIEEALAEIARSGG